MKQLLFVILFIFSLSSFSQEWTSLKRYQKTTKRQTLSQSNWLKKDRKHNTVVWQKANSYNLEHNLPDVYATIKQRRDFYKWYYIEINKKGHDVKWPLMAHFISNKLRLTNVFPFSVFTSKAIKAYALKGSQEVFNQSFKTLNVLFHNSQSLTKDEAHKWDEAIVHLEQYVWVESVYKEMPDSSVKTIERMAKRKFLYALVVPKAIKFEGNISKAKDRYQYAFNILKPYCEKQYRLR